MIKKDEQVEGYIKDAAPFAKPILKHLRKIIHETCPEAEEKMMHGYPSYSYRGSILCGILGFKDQFCGLFFGKTKLIDDPKKILESHSPIRDIPAESLTYITDIKNLPSDEVIIGFIKQAMKLNEDGVEDPNYKPGKTVKLMETPDFFLKELNKSKKAKAFYDGLPQIQKNHYIRFVEVSTVAATRDVNVLKAISWMEEGKERNWNKGKEIPGKQKKSKDIKTAN